MKFQPVEISNQQCLSDYDDIGTESFVRKQSGGSVFVLSEKFLTLSTPVAGEPAFIETALPFMRDPRDDTQETVLAGVLVGNEGVVLEQCEGLHPFSFRISTGLRFSLHTAAP